MNLFKIAIIILFIPNIAIASSEVMSLIGVVLMLGMATLFVLLIVSFFRKEYRRKLMRYTVFFLLLILFGYNELLHANNQHNFIELYSKLFRACAASLLLVSIIFWFL